MDSKGNCIRKKKSNGYNDVKIKIERNDDDKDQQTEFGITECNDVENIKKEIQLTNIEDINCEDEDFNEECDFEDSSLRENKQYAVLNSLQENDPFYSNASLIYLNDGNKTIKSENINDIKDSDEDLESQDEEPSDQQLNYCFGDNSDDSDDNEMHQEYLESDTENEEESTETSSFGWNSDLFTPKIVEFTGNPGLKVCVPSDNKFKWLELFITPELIKNIVSETNRYANQYFSSKSASFSKDSPFSARKKKEWRPVTKNEMYQFLGLYLLAGINKRPDFRMYWSKDDLFSSNIYKKVMRRERFFTISKFLHFCNDENIPKNNNDPLIKIREVVKYFTDRFKSVYIPERQIAIDEAMLNWKGRLRFKVCMADKSVTCGIKSYALTESLTGYIWNFNIYSGETKSVQETVLYLLDRLIDKGYFLFMGSFYNSVNLSELLLSKNTYVCGILRRKNGEPSKIAEKAKLLKQGETFFMSRGQVCIHVWRDTRVVKTISTIHAPEMEKVKNKYNPKDILKPVSVIDYIKYTKTVDKCDQMIKSYSCFRKVTKWQKKVFFYLLTISCANALILYNKQFPNKQSALSNFMLSIIDEMLKKKNKNIRTESVPYFSNLNPVKRLSGMISDHTMICNSPGRKGHSKVRNCVVCRKNKKKKRSAFRCQECNVVLCKMPCFKIYHTKNEY